MSSHVLLFVQSSGQAGSCLIENIWFCYTLYLDNMLTINSLKLGTLSHSALGYVCH
ncbi:hypothetical protein J6590_086732, partial [Homalodisca vitripennis]